MGDKKALLILTSSNTTLSTKTQFCCLLLFADSVYKSVHHCTVRWLGCNVVQPAEDISLSTLYCTTAWCYSMTRLVIYMVISWLSKIPKPRYAKENSDITITRLVPLE